MVRRACWAACWLTAVLAAGALAQTDQRPGPDGEFGKAIQVGRAQPVYFTLKSMEYRADRMMVDDYLWAPSEDDKLLVMHYTVQNPTKKTIGYDGLYPRFELYDAENNAYPTVDVPVGIGVGLEDTGKRPHVQLLPAHTIALYVAFRLPVKAEATKLIVLPTKQDEPVVRYALKGKITGLKPPYADPADATGGTMLVDVPAKLAEWYPLAWFDGRLDTLPVAANDLPTKAPRGTHWEAVTTTLRLAATKARNLSAASLPALLTLASGAEVKSAGLYQSDAWLPVNQEVRPKTELAVRLVFAVPDGAVVKTVRLRLAGLDNSWRKYTHAFVYEVPAVAATGQP